MTPVPYEEVVFSADTQYLQLNLPFKLTWADEATAPELKYSQASAPLHLDWNCDLRPHLSKSAEVCDTTQDLRDGLCRGAATQGLLASLDDIYNEYLTARNLSPLRVLLRGGPASGKSHLAAR